MRALSFVTIKINFRKKLRLREKTRIDKLKICITR